ncbi:hypothetical protein LXM94_01740 [Rhizobium sp. TRM95111]|nr:hypothetical protein [Rhizobium alarense]MCF3638693.1 hypothetical protein [Rhizobium alarense]
MFAMLAFSGTLIAVTFTYDFVRTIIELREERVAMKAVKREAGGFGV